MDIEKLGEVVSTDVLVIGGGLSGLVSAIKAKERQVDVLVVDRSGIGWAGQVPTGGGILMVIFPDDDMDDWVRSTVEDGAYLNNQDWTYALGQDSYQCFTDAMEWGLPFIKTEKGVVGIIPRFKLYKAVYWETDKVMIKLKKIAVSKGVRTLDKVEIVDLLRQDDRVIGAIGFGLVDGKTYIFKSKATIIANGNSRFLASKYCFNSGEGVSMAYRAGAELMNAEYGNGYSYVVKDYGTWRWEVMPLLENAMGERIIEKYYPHGGAGGVELIDAMAKEVFAGRGPIYLDLSKASAQEKEDIIKGKGLDPVARNWLSRALFKDIYSVLESKGKIDLNTDKVEFIPSFSGGMGAIRVKLDCKTTVEGLWAAGDACVLGSSYSGAQHPGARRGRGYSFAMSSGSRAGRSAAEHIAVSPAIRLNYEQLKHQTDRMLAPLNQKSGIEPSEIICKVQEAVVPLKYNFYRESSRLKEALGIIDCAQENLLRVKARDYHDLCNFHKAEAMTMSAELSLRAALMREESRGAHHRDDHLRRDDKNWLKWIVIKNEGASAKFWTEDVPIAKYKFKPLNLSTFSNIS